MDSRARYEQEHASNRSGIEKMSISFLAPVEEDASSSKSRSQTTKTTTTHRQAQKPRSDSVQHPQPPQKHRSDSLHYPQPKQHRSDSLQYPPQPKQHRSDSVQHPQPPHGQPFVTSSTRTPALLPPNPQQQPPPRSSSSACLPPNPQPPPPSSSEDPSPSPPYSEWPPSNKVGRVPRAPRPTYSEEQKFFIMYARIIQDKSWPDIEDDFTVVFGQRSKGGLCSLYYRIRRSWGLEDVLKTDSRCWWLEKNAIYQRASNFSRDFLVSIGYLPR